MRAAGSARAAKEAELSRLSRLSRELPSLSGDSLDTSTWSKALERQSLCLAWAFIGGLAQNLFWLTYPLYSFYFVRKYRQQYPYQAGQGQELFVDEILERTDAAVLTAMVQAGCQISEAGLAPKYFIVPAHIGEQAQHDGCRLQGPFASNAKFPK
eukprot:s2545_g9.t1